MKDFGLKKWFSLVLCCVVVLGVVPLVSACGFDDTVKRASKKLNAYTIAATLDDETKTITATQIVDIKNDSSWQMPQIWFHLYGRAFREGARVLPYSQNSIAKCFPAGASYGNMEVLSVKVDGEAAPFFYGGQDEDILVVDKPLDKGKSCAVEIAFVLTLAQTTHRLGYFDKNINLGNWYPVLCVFENGKFVADPYYSTGDPFFSECANYSVELSYPATYKIGATGNLSSKKQDGVVEKVNFNACAVRDFAVVLSQKFEEKSVRAGDTTVTFLGYVGDTDLDKNLDTAVLALKTYNSLFGEYPYRSLVVAKTPFLHGGMEYPNLVFVADNITDEVEMAKVIAHEIAHQWWYGLVGNNEVDCAYIDESLAEYSTALFFEKNDIYGYSGKQMVQDAFTSYELYKEVIDSIKGTFNDKLNQKVYEFETEYEYVYVVYVKGTLFLDALRTRVGDKDFFAALARYYKKFKFKNATRDDLIWAFSCSSGESIADFFEEWKA